jgi:hypothetical protein
LGVTRLNRPLNDFALRALGPKETNGFAAIVHFPVP